MPDGHAPCVLCSSTTRALLFSLDAGRIVRCDGCALVSMVGRNDNELIACDYDESYFFPAESKSVGYPDYFGAEAPLRRHVAEASASALLARFPEACSTLDVGCGGGYLVEALRRLGRDAWGVEPAAAVLEGADPAIRPHLVHGTLDTPAIRERGPYQLVTAMDVIEHIADPVPFIRSAFELVADGGALVLLTPRYDGWMSREHGSGYIHFNVDHVYYFSEQTLRQCVRRATGCEPVIVDVLSFWQWSESELAPEVQRKYTTQRDSMVAVCSAAPR